VRVLVVEDDDRVAAALAGALRRQAIESTRVSLAGDLWPLLDAADVVLLDLGLPDDDGVEVCRRIRASLDVPIIMITARSDIADRVAGLHSGADDYVVKPFDVRELVARLHAVHRRRPTSARPDGGSEGVLRPAEGIEIDLPRRRVTVDDVEIGLTRKEFEVLAMLAEADGAVCARDRIVAQVWGRSWPGADRTLDVHIATLRTKLGRPGVVATVRGVGYRMDGG
jgi:DNA-binding response OmpR family regulator